MASLLEVITMTNMVQWHRYSNNECSSSVTSAMFVQVGKAIVIAVVANESEVSDSVVVVVIQAKVETQLSKKEGGQVTTH